MAASFSYLFVHRHSVTRLNIYARFQHFGSSYMDQKWYIGLRSESFIFGVSSSGCTIAIHGEYLSINFAS